MNNTIGNQKRDAQVTTDRPDEHLLLSQKDKVNLASRMLFPGANEEADRWAYTTALRHKMFYQAAAVEQYRYEQKLDKAHQSEAESTPTFPRFEPVDDLGEYTRMIIPSQSLMTIFNPPPFAVSEDILHSSIYGQYVGAVLLYLYHLRNNPCKDDGLPAARSICLVQSRSVYKSVNGRPESGVRRIKSLTDKNLQVFFRKYRSVAHWWAAYVSLDKFSFQPTELPTPQTVGDMSFRIPPDIFSQTADVNIGNPYIKNDIETFTPEFLRRAKYFAKFGTRNFFEKPNKEIPLKTKDLYWPDGWKFQFDRSGLPARTASQPVQIIGTPMEINNSPITLTRDGSRPPAIPKRNEIFERNEIPIRQVTRWREHISEDPKQYLQPEISALCKAAS